MGGRPAAAVTSLVPEALDSLLTGADVMVASERQAKVKNLVHQKRSVGLPDRRVNERPLSAVTHPKAVDPLSTGNRPISSLPC
jgi:hypothetical protein